MTATVTVVAVAVFVDKKVGFHRSWNFLVMWCTSALVAGPMPNAVTMG
jgi:hypothetical protein